MDSSSSPLAAVRHGVRSARRRHRDRTDADGGIPAQDIGENHFRYLLRIWFEPMLWLAAALLLGGFRSRQIAERKRLAGELADMRAHRKTLAQHAGNLSSRCERLERIIAGRGAGTQLDMLASLTAIRRSGGLLEAVERTAEAIAIACAQPEKAATVSLFVRGVSGDLISSGAGHKVARGGATVVIERDDALIVALDERPVPVSVLTAEGERLLAGRASAALPIVAGDDRAVTAVLLVSDIPADWLEGEALLALAAVGDALSGTLRRLAGGQGRFSGIVATEREADAAALRADGETAAAGVMPALRRAVGG